MKKLFKTVLAFIILALGIEVVILIATKATGWDNFASGRPFLAAVHVHLFVLGVLFFLVQMLLEKVFGITKAKFYNVFYIVFLSGLGVFIATLLYKGFAQIFGFNVISAITQMCAALAHIAMFVGLFFFARCLYQTAVKTEIAKDENTQCEIVKGENTQSESVNDKNTQNESVKDKNTQNEIAKGENAQSEKK